MITGSHMALVEVIDKWLDAEVSQEYKDQPLAQHWARVAKVTEECGEAIDELILSTGQNPRKPRSISAYHRMLAELADTAITATLAIQHFTKNTGETDGYLNAALDKAGIRAMNAGYAVAAPPDET